MKNNKGFTLAELLITVAIISVLTSVSLPVFTTKLENSREKTDISNMRSAYSLAVAGVLAEEKIDGKLIKNTDSSAPLYYDAENGVLTAVKPTAYGKGTEKSADTAFSRCGDHSYNASDDYTDSVIVVYVTGDTVHIHWDKNGASNGSEVTDTSDINTGFTPNTPAKLTAIQYPSGDESIQIYAGKLYEYQGKNYVCTTDIAYSQYNRQTPDNTGEWGFVEFTNNANNITTMGHQDTGVKRGDIFIAQNGDKYIRRTDAQWWDDPITAPSEVPGNWIKIEN